MATATPKMAKAIPFATASADCGDLKPWLVPSGKSVKRAVLNCPNYQDFWLLHRYGHYQVLK